MAQLDQSNLAVLLIDMQDHFTYYLRKKSIIPNQVNVIEFFRDKNVPIIVVTFNGYGDVDEQLKQAIKNVNKNDVYEVKKDHNDAFSSFELNSILNKRGIGTLLLMGINAGYCVYSTAKSAIKNGYNIVTSDDLIAGHYPSDSTDCKDFSWYEKNGIVKKDHFTIMKEIIGP